MAGYTKLFSDIVESSIWDEDAATCKVWITMLALCDSEGFIRGSPGWLAKRARVQVEECLSALKKFQSPDPLSRTKDKEGRRIEETPDGWVIVNYLLYRSMDGRELSKDARRVYQRNWMRNKRSQQKLTPVNVSQPSASASASVQEGGTGGGSQQTIPEKVNTPEFLSVWSQWMEWRRGKKSCKDFDTLFSRQLEWLAEFGPAVAVEIMKTSMRNDWQGLFAPKGSNEPTRQPHDRNANTANESWGDQYNSAAALKSQQKSQQLPGL